jgi:hypothetical protein
MMGSTQGMAGPVPADEIFDTSKIWKAAIDEYEKNAGVRIATLNSVNTIEGILNEVNTSERRFLTRRHDGSRADRLRAILSQSLRPIEQLLNVATQVSKGVSLSNH